MLSRLRPATTTTSRSSPTARSGSGETTPTANSATAPPRARPRPVQVTSLSAVDRGRLRLGPLPRGQVQRHRLGLGLNNLRPARKRHHNQPRPPRSRSAASATSLLSPPARSIASLSPPVALSTPGATTATGSSGTAPTPTPPPRFGQQPHRRHPGRSRLRQQLRPQIRRYRLVMGLRRLRRARQRLHLKRDHPRRRQSITGVTTIGYGGLHTVAAKADGTYLGWGYNGYGQIGNGNKTNAGTPAQTRPLGAMSASKAASTAASRCAATEPSGRGARTTTASSATARPPTPGHPSRSAPSPASPRSRPATTTASPSNPTAPCGPGGTTVPACSETAPKTSSTPVQVSSLTDVVAIAAGYGDSIALKSDGTVWTWGDNSYGGLGTGSSAGYSDTPVEVTASATSYRSPAAGDHCLAVESSGTVWAWGATATASSATAPPPTNQPRSRSAASPTRSAVAAARGHSLALTSSGTVYAWGYNGDGQLGNGTYTQETNPGRGQQPHWRHPDRWRLLQQPRPQSTATSTPGATAATANSETAPQPPPRRPSRCRA